ncbi:MAG TPA: hypothetical protein VD815_04420 [Candidatus Saccharimonadales bacterium]|nr:hypothetical protein [Candidatus Saccharimonadales bacterium]
MNSSLSSIFLNPVYSRTHQDQEDTSGEIGDGFQEGNEKPETSNDATKSEETDESNDDGSNNDLSSSGQNNECPNTNDLSNVPTFIGEDGCRYPCSSPDNNGQGNNPQSCPIGESSSQSPSGFSINEEQPIQTSQQQSLQPNPTQNSFTNPQINSDTTLSSIPNTETTTTTTTQKSFNHADQYKPGSGQTEFTIPGKSESLARPYTPGAGNAQVEGIPVRPDTNPRTPIDPGNIVTTILDKAYLTVITKMMNFYTNYLKVSDFEICVSTTVQSDGNSKDVNAIPNCAKGSGSGVQYTVQAPGSITIWVNNLDELGVKSVMIETPNLSNYINAHESKTSTIYISPY